MDVMIPIGIGFLINLAALIIFLIIFKDLMKSSKWTLYLSILIFVLSIFIGGWRGMGLGVISFGMFALAIITLTMAAFRKTKVNNYK